MAIVREKSRRDRRKEVRLEKKRKKSDYWIQNQQYHKQKKSSLCPIWKDTKKSSNLSSQCSKEREISETNLHFERYHSLEQPTTDNSKVKLDSSGSSDSSSLRVKGRNTKNKFEEYLEMEMQPGAISAEEDLELERKLAKKLKVKDGKLGGADDDINILLEGISEEVQKKCVSGSSPKKRKKSMLLDKEPEGDSKKILKRKKTKFEKYLHMEMQGVASEEADLYMEKKLAKKLKVKEGKLRGDDDGVNLLIEGIPSALGFYENEGDLDDNVLRKCSKSSSTIKKNRQTETSEKEPETEMAGDTAFQVSKSVETFPPAVVLEKVPTKASESEGSAKYVAPHLRSLVRNESEEYIQLRRRIRGLLNRLSESNVESITGEMSTIFRSVARGVSSQIITEEILASCSGGPRGNEQFLYDVHKDGTSVLHAHSVIWLDFPAIWAVLCFKLSESFVAGMACFVGIDFGAKLLDSLAKCFEAEYLQQDNLSLRNLTLLLSYLYIFGVCSSDLIYDFMILLSKRLMETDVSTILTVLQCCGMNLRGDDPVAMKIFVLSVQNSANELKASSGSGQPNTSGKRMEFMLETICEIKNNKKRAREDTPQHTRIKKWLQKLRAEDILIRGLKWSKLLDPDKKGQWWLSGDLASSTINVEEVASTSDMESLEAQKLLQLAAAQRMNTDIRRAIFCIIMSGEDYVDAFEKLLRLDLQGKQDREIMRVLVECCLQEKVFNKYYSVLASKFCKHDNNYATTLKFCLWDHFKELESMDLMRSRNLSKFVVEMIASFTLSLSVLKKVDFSDTTWLTRKVIMHFRMLFEALFEQPDRIVWNVFTRIAADPDLESLQNGLEFFIKNYVVSSDNSLAKKYKVAKKALGNVVGVLM